MSEGCASHGGDRRWKHPPFLFLPHREEQPVIRTYISYPTTTRRGHPSDVSSDPMTRHSSRYSVTPGAPGYDGTKEAQKSMLERPFRGNQRGIGRGGELRQPQTATGEPQALSNNSDGRVLSDSQLHQRYSILYNRSIGWLLGPPSLPFQFSGTGVYGGEGQRRVTSTESHAILPTRGV